MSHYKLHSSINAIAVSFFILLAFLIQHVVSTQTCKHDNLIVYFPFQQNTWVGTSKILNKGYKRGFDLHVASGAKIDYGACREGFNASGSYGYIRNISSELLPSSQYTIDFWFKMVLPSQEKQTIFYLHTYPSLEFYSKDNNLYLVLDDEEQEPIHLLTGLTRDYHDNQWHHFKMEKRGAVFEVILDGVESSSSVYNSMFTFPYGVTRSLTLGANNQNQFKYRGSIDEFRIWTCTDLPEPSSVEEACPKCTGQNDCTNENQGICVAENLCICEDGYTGESCEGIATCFGKTNDDEDVCLGRGKCVSNDKCLCSDGYSGNQCQFKFEAELMDLPTQTGTELCSNSSLTLYLSFDSEDVYETSTETRFLDFSGNKKYAKVLGGPEFSLGDGRCHQSANFSTTGYYLKVDGDPTLMITDYMSFEFYYKLPREPQQTEQTIAHFFSDPSIEVVLNNTNLVVLLQEGEKTTIMANHDHLIGNWEEFHHIALIKRGSSCEIIIDDVFDYPSICNTKASTVFTNGATIGADSDGNKRFYGAVDELRIATCANISLSHVSREDGCPICEDGCSQNAQCVADDICQCKFGASGSDCSTLDCSMFNNCNGNGECVLPPQNKTTQCSCYPGYTGPGSSVPKYQQNEEVCKYPICYGIPSYDQTVCSGNGTCVGPNNCKCFTGFRGCQCNQRDNATCEPGYHHPPDCNLQFTDCLMDNSGTGCSSFTNIGASTETNCERFFNAETLQKLGSGARCEVTSTKFTIHFGVGATLVPEEKLYIVPYNITISVLAPKDPVKPNVRVEVPGKLRYCEGVIINAGGTSSPDGRPLDYKYALISPDDSELEKFLASQRGSLVFINGSLLTDGNSYEIKLTVTTFIGGSDSLNFTISNSKPVEQPPIYAYRHEVVIIDPQLQVDPCGNTNKKLINDWKQIYTDPTHKVKGFDSLPKNFTTLTIPRYSFPITNIAYRFEYTAISEADGARISLLFTVHIMSSELVATIKGGNTGGTVGTEIALSNELHDPDEDTATPSYLWECSGEGRCELSNPTSDATTFKGHGSGTYTVTLKITKGSRTATASTFLVLSESVVPKVTVEKIQPEGPKVSSISRVVLSGNVESPGEHVYNWKIIDCPLKTKLNSSSQLLVIPPNQIDPGQCRIRFEAINSADTVGFAEITFEVVAPPSSGNCIVSPTKGQPLETKFLLQCQQWVGEGLKYSFEYINPETGDVVVLSTLNSLTALHNVYLPPGRKEDGQLTLRALVTDSFGASVPFLFNVIMEQKQLDESEKVELVQKKFDEILKETQQIGDPTATVRVANSLISTLNIPRSVPEDRTKCINDCSVNGEERGKCVIKNNKAVCECNPGWASEDCSLTTEVFRQRVELREKIIANVLTSISTSVNSEQDLKHIVSTTSGLVSNADELTSTTQQQILDLVTDLSKSTQFINTESAQSFTNILSSLASGFDQQLSLRSHIYSLYGQSAEKQKTQQFFTIIGNVLNGLLASKVRGDPASNIKSRNVILYAQRNTQKSYEGQYVFVAEGSEVFIPTGIIFQNVQPSDDIDMTAVIIDANPFQYTNNSNMTTRVFDLSFSSKGNPVEVKDLVNPISFSIPGIFNPSEYQNFSMNVNASGLAPVCMYLDEQIGVWNDSGCEVEFINSTLIRCLCNHTTIFGGFENWITKIIIPDPPLAFWHTYATVITSVIFVIPYTILLILTSMFDKFIARRVSLASIKDIIHGRFRAIVEEILKTHLYISLFFLPMKSELSFTRPQRLTVITTTLFAIICANTIFYAMYPTTFWFASAIMSCLASIPVTWFFSLLFTKTQPKPLIKTKPIKPAPKELFSNEFEEIEMAAEVGEDYVSVEEKMKSKKTISVATTERKSEEKPRITATQFYVNDFEAEDFEAGETDESEEKDEEEDKKEEKIVLEVEEPKEKKDEETPKEEPSEEDKSEKQQEDKPASGITSDEPKREEMKSEQLVLETEEPKEQQQQEISQTHQSTTQDKKIPESIEQQKEQKPNDIISLIRQRIEVFLDKGDKILGHSKKPFYDRPMWQLAIFFLIATAGWCGIIAVGAPILYYGLKWNIGLTIGYVMFMVVVYVLIFKGTYYAHKLDKYKYSVIEWDWKQEKLNLVISIIYSIAIFGGALASLIIAAQSKDANTIDICTAVTVGLWILFAMSVIWIISLFVKPPITRETIDLGSRNPYWPWPYWTSYIIYGLSYIIICVFIAISVAYGINFYNETTGETYWRDWVGATLMAFLLDFVIVKWILVFARSFVYPLYSRFIEACFFYKTVYKEKENEDDSDAGEISDDDSDAGVVQD